MMNNYFLRKIISSILVLLIVISATFLLLRILPGGPFESDKKLPPQIKINIEKKYKLNEPLYVQYFDYMKNTLKFKLGPS